MSGEIFVVGASRSGTNLVRALLNAHSTLWISGETHYFDDLRPRLPGNGTEPLAGEDRDRCERYFLALSHRAFGQAGDPGESRFDRDELRAARGRARRAAATRTSRRSAACARPTTAASAGARRRPGTSTGSTSC